MKKLLDDFTRNEILEISREFKKRRNLLGFSQLKLAKLANISQSIINKLENGKIDPTYSTILKIEKALEKEENIKHKKAKQIMVKEIISISPQTKIFKALEIMRNNDFSQLLVIQKNKVIGTIYEKTILDTIAQKIDIYNESIKKFVDKKPIIVPSNYNSVDLKYIFQNRNTKFVLVQDDEEILGIVTKSDLFQD